MKMAKSAAKKSGKIEDRWREPIIFFVNHKILGCRYGEFLEVKIKNVISVNIKIVKPRPSGCVSSSL